MRAHLHGYTILCWGVLIFVALYVLVLCSFFESRRFSAFVVGAYLRSYTDRAIVALDDALTTCAAAARDVAGIIEEGRRYSVDNSSLALDTSRHISDIMANLRWGGDSILVFIDDATDSGMVFDGSGHSFNITDDLRYLLTLNVPKKDGIHIDNTFYAMGKKQFIPIVTRVEGANSGSVVLLFNVARIMLEMRGWYGGDNFQIAISRQHSALPLISSLEYRSWQANSGSDYSKCMDMDDIVNNKARLSLFSLTKRLCANGSLERYGISIITLFSAKVASDIFVSNFIAAISMSIVMMASVILAFWALYRLISMDVNGIAKSLDSLMVGRYESYEALFGIFSAVTNKIISMYYLINGIRSELCATSDDVVRLSEEAQQLGALKNMALQSNKDALMKYNDMKFKHEELSLQWKIVCDKYEFCSAENDKLQALNRQKSEFLANISHEILTPLNAMLGFAEILRGNKELPDVRRIEYINHIYDSGRYMAALTKTFLSFAKAEYGVISLNESDVDLRGLINECVTMITQIRSDVPIVLDLSPMAYAINADGLRLKQAINNLLANAVKFSVAGDPVVITTRVTPPCIEIVITDTGIGIVKEDIPKIMEMFGQANTDRSDCGIGIGLALSKKIVEMHGGALRLYSRVAKGTSAVIELPVLRLRQFTAIPRVTTSSDQNA